MSLYCRYTYIYYFLQYVAYIYIYTVQAKTSVEDVIGTTKTIKSFYKINKKQI